jgi:hypothetical protein
MVLKTNTRNSLVDDVYDVLISVCLVQQRSKLVLPGLKVYGGCFRGHRDARSKTAEEREDLPWLRCWNIQKELCISF